MKRMWNVLKRDMRSNLRDAMAVWIMLVPIVITLLLKLFIPAANTASLQFAVLKSDEKLASYMEQYGEVETFDSLDALNARVERTDDITGIVEEDGSFQIIMEGNETEGIRDTAESILMAYTGVSDPVPVDVEVSRLGWQVSLTALIGGITMIMMASLLGAMLSGLNIVEERQMKTMKAIKVSPLTTSEFVIAKSTPGIVIPLIQSILILLILGLTDINWWMAIVITVASSLIGLIIGIMIGVMNEDALTAISSIKVMLLPMTASILGALLLPQNWLPVLYWSPFYWTYRGFSEIILKSAAWGDILLYCGIILGITVLVYALLVRKIKRGLAA